MRNINYGLIVSDYDGTLAREDRTVSEENINAISEYTNAGGIFAISTGRLPAAILPQVRDLGLKGYICCGQGTIILDIDSGEVVFEKRLSLETTLNCCRKMEEMGLHINAFDLWKYYSNIDNEQLALYEKLSKSVAIRVTDRRLSEFLEENSMSAYKLLAIVKPEENIEILEKLMAENLPGCEITKSMDFLVEVVNNKYSKGTALAYLADKYGISIGKTIAIGDNFNDISMIERAGLGIAVNNAENKLKECADYVCEYTNEESAVARIIEKFAFSHSGE